MKLCSLLFLTSLFISNAQASCQNVSFQLERIAGFDSRCAKVLPEGEYQALICGPGQSVSITNPNGINRILSYQDGKLMSVKAKKEVFSVNMRMTEVQVIHFNTPSNAIVCKGYFYR